ncbi:STAS/SEC14 domain-containing protein [Flavobacteriaceae bacterium LYZ1037]|nr:STAS/SEC14 domain-containing protein [Flavobacteriaceae bacterium LYZ1037]
MIEHLKTFETNTLAFEVIENFSETDEKLAQKFFKEKLDKGFNTVNVLVKIDEYKMSNTQAKAFFEDIIFILRHYKNLGHLAIVAHSKVLKAFVPIDNMFFERASKGRKEQYFDVSQLDEAFKFVTNN